MTLAVYIDDPSLRGCVMDVMRAHALHDFTLVDHHDAAELSVSDMPRDLRIGVLVDWILSRAHEPGRHLPATIDLATGVFTRAGNTFTPHTGDPVRLTDRERDLLLALYVAADHTMTRDDILAQIWGYVPGLETHTLETHIYRLRQKIETDPGRPTVLVTGENTYRLVV